MIDVVFLDFSGTLVDGEFDVRECRKSAIGILSSWGHDVSLADYDRAMEYALKERRAARMAGRELTFKRIETTALRRLGISPSPRLIAEIEQAEFNQYSWRMKRGAKEALHRLRSKYRLGIISNGMTNSAQLVLDKEGLLPLFEEIVVSKDVGYRKPDPRIFRYSLTKLCAKAEQTVFVGDSYAQDVLGAKAVGMKTIWLAESKSESFPYFDGVAEDIRRVPGLIAALDTGSV